MNNKDYIEGDWIYDIECYPNIFTLCAMYANGAGIRVFEISERKNDTTQLLSFLREVVKRKHRMVGFNNIGFDYPLLHNTILEPASICDEEFSADYTHIYNEMLAMFERNSDDRFGTTIKNPWIKQVDLFKIHHFDNKSRSTSLKMLEFNMRSPNIADLPYPPGTILTSDQMDELIKYNENDVRETLNFYLETVQAIRFRETLTKQYGFDCTNFNDTKIGKEYFINRLEKSMPGCCYKQTAHGRKMQQTKRNKIIIDEVLLPYVSFTRPEFQAIHQWFKEQVITETKGVFSEIKECDLGDVAKYAEMRVVRKKIKGSPTPEDLDRILSENPKSWIDTVELKSKKNAKSYWLCWNEATVLNVVVDGFRFDFGTGGIHGSLESSIIYSNDDVMIRDCDVSSMYPNLAIVNGVYPKHLGKEFCSIYQDVYNERKTYTKSDPANAVMKLALNGVYGDSNNQYSPFYDPQYTMTITINGQLSLCMLAERLLSIDGCKLIQINTDGITVTIPTNKDEEYYIICREWEKDVGLQLEYADYDGMFIRDVNNYIASFTNGKVKRKGAYEYEGLGWHQNHSALVIRMAAEHELLGKGNADSFIRCHDNKFDFMLCTKVPRSSKLVLVDDEGNDTLLQNICRYYPSKKGGSLIKVMPPLQGKEDAGDRRIAIDKEWKVEVCNNILDFDWDVDYDYYIQAAQKLIDLSVITKDDYAAN